MIWYIVSLGAAVLAACFLGHYWGEVREEIAGWLRNRGLAASHIMNAWVRLDNLISSVRSRIYVRTSSGEFRVSEKVLTFDEIDDPEVREALRNSGLYERNVMNLVE